jgi:hypothetical protein
VEGGIADVREVTLEQFSQSEAELSARIKAYAYPRRSSEKLKRDKETLRHMRKLDRNVTPLIPPRMKVGLGMDLHEKALQRPARKQRKAAAKQATGRRWPSA